MSIFHDAEEENELTEDNAELLSFVSTNLLHFDKVDHLPVPVYSYIKPTMGPRFILHILISLGQFETKIDLTLHESLQNSLRHAKLIGESDSPEDLQMYSKRLLSMYITEQLVTFPNSQRILDAWIIKAGQ